MSGSLMKFVAGKIIYKWWILQSIAIGKASENSDVQDDAFHETMDAMRAFGLSDDLSGILSTLLAVLHLGLGAEMGDPK